MNVMKTGLLLAALTALFGVAGYLLGGQTGMLIALGIAAVTNLFAYWNGDKLALSAHGAVEVDDAMAPELVGMVRQLSARAGLPMPRVYLIDNPQPNAFATGRNPDHAAVAATTGLLRSLSYEEVAGVMAHELAHVRNRDTLIMTVTATIAGAVSMLANFGLFFGGGNGQRNNPLGAIGTILLVFLAPLAAMIVQMAISRTREYAADRGGAEICGRPLWLAKALENIQASAARIDNVQAENNPATAHMFIINPLSGQRMDNLFSTHPATENRLAALQQLAGQMGQSGYRPAAAARSVPRTAPRGPWGGSGGASRPRGPWG